MPRITVEHEEATRQRIVDAAVRAFTERGFHQATIQDVVRECGLSVGAIYTYFSGKDELLLASCDLIASRELGLLFDRMAEAGTVREKLEAALQVWFDELERDAGQSRFIVQAWAEANQQPVIREMLARRRERIVTVAAMLLREGVTRGELPSSLDVEPLARALCALLDGFILQRIEDGERFHRAQAERRARAMVDLLYSAADVPAAP